MKSSSQHLFAQVPTASIPRSSFRRDMSWKTAFDSGYLVPIFVDEALPGDTFNCKLTQFARLSSPLSQPIMDNIYMDTFFFAVPVRILWDHFVNMCGEQKNPTDSIDYLAPILKKNSSGKVKIEENSLSDYFGIPPGEYDPEFTPITSLWHRAYNKIWNEWFRDENLQNSVYESTSDEPDDLSNFQLLRRGKRHDYFTSCLPFVQKGPEASVTIFDNTEAPVWGTGERIKLVDSSGNVDSMFRGSGTSGNLVYRANLSYSGLNPLHFPNQVEAGGDSPLYADLAEASSLTINKLREAFAVQRFCERAARSGTRFFEILHGMFGVTSPDSRLQRPEYLGGGRFPIQMHTVAQTSSSDDTTPQGNLTAYGVGGTQCGFVKSFVEHSVIIGLACVRADLTYQQGIHKMFSRRSRFDWYWPAFHNLGEQAVYNREIYAQGTAADGDVFGYQERFAEYRYGQSRITGKMRSQSPLSLDVWHLAQDFANLPALNSQFIEEHPPLDRVLAVTDEPQIIYDSLISLNCVRPMGVYSVPGMIDHM